MISQAMLFLIVTMSLNSCNDFNSFVQGANQRISQSMQPLFQQSVVVPPGKMASLQFTVPGDWSTGHVIGHFSTAGGGGNDIQVVVTDSDGYANYINGHQARVWYDSGKVTADSFDLRLAPGLYYLIFNNAFSVVSNKAVTLDVQMGP